MNSHTRALQRKFAVTSTVLSAVLPRTGRARPWQVALTSLNVSLGNYLVGDLFVKPRYGRLPGAFTAGVGAGLITILTSRFLPGMRVGTVGTLASGGAVGLAEWFSEDYLEEESYLASELGAGEREGRGFRALPGVPNDRPRRRSRRAIPIKRRSW